MESPIQGYEEALLYGRRPVQESGQERGDHGAGRAALYLAAGSGRALPLPDPAGEAGDSLLDGRGGSVAEDLLRAGYVGPRPDYVAGLHGEPLDGGLDVEGVADQPDQPGQGRGPAAAQVDDSSSPGTVRVRSMAAVTPSRMSSTQV
jgi:hypothetical protein